MFVTETKEKKLEDYDLLSW